MNELMTEVFVEQPQALPGSAKYYKCILKSGPWHEELTKSKRPSEKRFVFRFTLLMFCIPCSVLGFDSLVFCIQFL